MPGHTGKTTGLPVGGDEPFTNYES